MTNLVASTSYDIFTLDENIVCYLLSDRSTPGLNQVVSGDLTPLAFASEFVKGATSAQFVDRFLKVSLSDELTQLWLFDHVMRVSSMWRVTNLPAIPAVLVQELASDAAFYSLTTATKDRLSWFTGISSFRAISEECAGYICQPNMIQVVDLLGKTIGDVTDKNWLLNKPSWKKVFWDDRDSLLLLRQFLHVVLILAQSQDFSQLWFGAGSCDVRADALEFLDLAEDPKVTPYRIRSFLEHVSEYAEDHPAHSLHELVVRAPFATLKHFSQVYFGPHQEAHKSSLPDEASWDQEEWDSLRSLGDAFDPTLTVTTELLPSVYCDAIVAQIHDSEVQKNLREFCDFRNVELRVYGDGKFDDWAKAELLDNLRATVVERRLASLCEDLDHAVTLLKSSSHILLLLDSNNEARMGFSFFEQWLGFHTSDRSGVMKEDEVECLRDLHVAWSDLRIDRPHRLPPAWGKAFENYKFRSTLRSWLFTVIEIILSDPTTDLTSVLKVDRAEIFNRIHLFTQWLNDDYITEDQIYSFVNQLPCLNQGLVMDPWFLELWDFSYSAISPSSLIKNLPDTEDDSSHGHTFH